MIIRERAAIAVAMCVGVSLLTGGASAEDQQRTVQSAVSSVTPDGSSAAKKRTIADQVWKRIAIGAYRNANAVRAALAAAGVRIGDSADEILGRPAFPFSKDQLDLDLVVRSVSELGFDDATSLADIYRRANELGLELCPAEVAPALRLEYIDQPIGEILNIAMLPIMTYGGEPVALSVGNAGTGPLILGGRGDSSELRSWMAKFVFVRPQTIALPNWSGNP